MTNKLQIAGKILDKGANTFTNNKQTGLQRHIAYNIHLQISTQEKKSNQLNQVAILLLR